MAPNTALYARARYCVDALTPLLPLVHLQVYMPGKTIDEAPDLYLLGFILRDILLGGYTLPPPLVTADCGLMVLRAEAFFTATWQAGETRFHPEGLQHLYETHLAYAGFWERLL